MARPTKQPAEARSTWLPPMRVTEAERLHVEEQAAAAGLSLSDYGRRRMLGYRVRPRTTAAEDALLLALNRIGVNLNQIARAANTGDGVPDTLHAAVAELREAMGKLVG